MHPHGDELHVVCTSLDLAYARRFRDTADQLHPHAVEAVRLFGSRARDEARADSDLDMLVVVNSDDRKLRHDLLELAFDIAYEMELPYHASALVMSADHFQRLQALETKLAHDILRDGVAV